MLKYNNDCILSTTFIILKQEYLPAFATKHPFKPKCRKKIYHKSKNNKPN